MRRWRTVQVGVVQHRAMLVEGDDVAVRQFVFSFAHGAEIGHVDRVFGIASAERGFGGTVRARAELARHAHHRQFVVGLVGAVIMQIIQHRQWIVRHDIVERRIVFADDRATRQRLWANAARASFASRTMAISKCSVQ